MLPNGGMYIVINVTISVFGQRIYRPLNQLLLSPPTPFSKLLGFKCATRFRGFDTDITMISVYFNVCVDVYFVFLYKIIKRFIPKACTFALISSKFPF